MSFSTGVWTPGGSKPVEKSTSGTKRPRSVESATTAPTTRTAQLSGATRNMRFMQRHSQSPKEIPKQLSPPPHTVNDERVMDETRIDTNANTDMAIEPNNCSTSNVLAEQASPLDMYGREQCLLLGRRSFGGFNPTTAENLHAQQSHLDGLRPKRAQTASEAQSDQKLVQRYKELVHDQNGSDRMTHPRNKSNSDKKKNGISNQRKRKGGLDDMVVDS